MDEEIPQERRIQGQEDWLRANALGFPSATSVHLEEERARLIEFSEYEASVHRRIFADKEEEERNRCLERQERMKAWKDKTIVVYTSGEPLRDVPLQPLAESCETIFALASSWNFFSSNELQEEKFHVSLQDFSEDSVRAFISLVNSTKSTKDLDGETIVDCCQIASYLQNTVILRATEIVLLESIDTDNCLSICQLADQLNLIGLFEASVRHMINSLMRVENDSQMLECLTPELQEKIQAIKSAFSSSVHSNKSSSLYFSSLTEYLSIFAERVQYYRERLADAREQHRGMITGTRAWSDTGTKIKRQEHRVHTLEIVLAEQKKLFSGKGWVGRNE